MTCHALFGSVLIIAAFQDHQEDLITLNPVGLLCDWFAWLLMQMMQ